MQFDGLCVTYNIETAGSNLLLLKEGKEFKQIVGITFTPICRRKKQWSAFLFIKLGLFDQYLKEAVTKKGHRGYPIRSDGTKFFS